MRTIDKIMVTIVILVVSFIICVRLLAIRIGKEEDLYKLQIGQKIILEKDTLTVVDYSLITETVTLSNGIKVNASMVFNLSKNR